MPDCCHGFWAQSGKWNTDDQFHPICPPAESSEEEQHNWQPPLLKPSLVSLVWTFPNFLFLSRSLSPICCLSSPVGGVVPLHRGALSLSLSLTNILLLSVFFIVTVSSYFLLHTAWWSASAFTTQKNDFHHIFIYWNSCSLTGQSVQRQYSLCGALPGPGDVLPPQRGEVSLLAGRGEGFGLWAVSWSLSLQLGNLESNEDLNHKSYKLQIFVPLPVLKAQSVIQTITRDKLTVFKNSIPWLFPDFLPLFVSKFHDRMNPVTCAHRQYVVTVNN